MRILTITTSYPAHGNDWRGGFVAAMNRALETRGHQVVTVTPGPWRLFHSHGVAETLRRRPWLAVQLPVGASGLFSRARQEARDCDVVLSHWLIPSGVIGAHLRSRGGPGHVAIVHGGDLRALETLPRALAAPWLRRIAGGLDRVQVVAPWQAKSMTDLCPSLADRIDIEPMGVNLVEAPAAPPPPPLRVLYVGRLVQRKGVATLLDAVISVPEVELTIAGDGPERARLEAMARRGGRRIRFLGSLPPSKIPALYPEHHLIGAPSLPYPRGGEGTPTSVLEAMAAGLVPLASAVGGLADLLAPGGRGVLVPPGDVKSLSEVLVRLLGSRSLLAHLSEGSRACAEAHAWPAVAARVEARLLATSRA